MDEGLGLHFMWISELKSGFWNFSRNRLAVTHDPPGDTSTRSSFWVSSMNRLAAENKLLGGTNIVMLFLAILDLFGGTCDIIVMFICLNENLRSIVVCVCYGSAKCMNSWMDLGIRIPVGAGINKHKHCQCWMHWFCRKYGCMNKAWTVWCVLLGVELINWYICD